MKEIEKELIDYYKKNLDVHGSCAKGVGWKNETAQVKRFAQFQRILFQSLPTSINDLGCGTGDFFSFLTDHQYQVSSYSGYDVLNCMIEAATERFSNCSSAQFFLIEKAKEIQVNEYTFASGIFNLRYTVSNEVWLEYILETIDVMYNRSLKGFGFNVLTKYSDAALMQDHLYYGDPLFLFDYCKRNFSKNVALLHDYDEFDFTILVRK